MQVQWGRILLCVFSPTKTAGNSVMNKNANDNHLDFAVLANVPQTGMRSFLAEGCTGYNTMAPALSSGSSENFVDDEL